MKFGQTLSTHLTPEWRKQYISYADFKRMIYNAIENMPEEVKLNTPAYQNYIVRFDEAFFQECDNELLKINSFFAEKLAEAKRKFQELRIELENIAQPAQLLKTFSKVNLTKYLPKRKTSHLKFIMSEYYLSLVLLQNYQTLNHTGFRKILKKHDKNLQVSTGKEWFKKFVENSAFATNTEIKSLIRETETIFINNLEGGDRSKAMKRLRVPPFEELQSPWRTFRLGLALGVFLSLCVVICIVTAQSLELPPKDLDVFKKLHRPFLLLTLFLFLMGFNVYGWQKAGVNHILIFEIDPRDHLTATHLLEIAAFAALLCALSLLACLLLVAPLPPYVYPLILALAFIFWWIDPLPCQWSSRFWLMKVVGRIICAPLFPVGFADFWLADQLISLSLIFTDYEFLVCFYVTNNNWYRANYSEHCESQHGKAWRAIIYSLPAWWRFAQCLRRYYDSRRVFPFLVNAGKYASVFPVNGFNAALNGNTERAKQNPLFWCLIVCRIVNTTFSFMWDVFMDFGLFRKFKYEQSFLRDELLYMPIVYYLVVIEDLLLRLYWLYAIFLINYMSPFDITTLGALLEVFRRFIWNFLRLENEHLTNAGQFRAVRDISIVPLIAEDPKRLEKLMDESDGVKNRKKSESDEDDEED